VNETARTDSVADDGRLSMVLLALLVAVSLAADFFMAVTVSQVPARPDVLFPLFSAILGCTLAQGCLLAAWLAWSCQPFWKRLAGHWIVAAILYLVWLAGLMLTDQTNEAARVAVTVGLAVPLISVAAQLPLWIARHLFGWRLVRNGGEDGADREALSIRDLMTATVVVALALALVRAAPSLDNEPILMPWVIMAGVAAVISAMTLLPVAPLLLRRRPFSAGVFFGLLYAGCWIGLIWAVVLTGWNWGLFQPPPMAAVIGVSLLILSFAATVILAAAIARRRGYRLAAGRPRRANGDGGATLC